MGNDIPSGTSNGPDGGRDAVGGITVPSNSAEAQAARDFVKDEGKPGAWDQAKSDASRLGSKYGLGKKSGDKDSKSKSSWQW